MDTADVLILLAGLIGVPEDQLRAATLLALPGGSARHHHAAAHQDRHRDRVGDPRGRDLQRFRYALVMTGGGPGVATETISVYIYKITTRI